MKHADSVIGSGTGWWGCEVVAAVRLRQRDHARACVCVDGRVRVWVCVSVRVRMCVVMYSKLINTGAVRRVAEMPTSGAGRCPECMDADEVLARCACPLVVPLLSLLPPFCGVVVHTRF